MAEIALEKLTKVYADGTDALAVNKRSGSRDDLV